MALQSAGTASETRGQWALSVLQALWRNKLEGWLKVFVVQVGESFDAELWRRTYVGDLE